LVFSGWGQAARADWLTTWWRWWWLDVRPEPSAEIIELPQRIARRSS